MWKIVAALGMSVLVGCAPEPAADSDPDGAAAAEPGLIEGTPAGDLEVWVADVRGVLEGLPESAARDRSAAQQAVLDMYIGRQEYIEMYYGPGGRLAADGALPEAVAAAEERFHALMQALGSPDASAEEVEAARDALAAQYDVVLREAARSGIPLDPRAAPEG